MIAVVMRTKTIGATKPVAGDIDRWIAVAVPAVRPGCLSRLWVMLMVRDGSGGVIAEDIYCGRRCLPKSGIIRYGRSGYSR